MNQTYSFRPINKCRICGNIDLVEVLDLGDHYLSGIFPKENERTKIFKAPLKLLKCVGDNNCGLVQLSGSIDSSLMYGENYGYRSGLNPSMLVHLQSKVKKIESMISLQDSDVVIDIGSNDASTLKGYQNQSLTLIGVDPTGIKFQKYYPEHIALIKDFFPSQSLFNTLANRKAKVITSFSMFYDLEDPVKFAECIEATLDNNGIWIFEQSYAPSMINANSFDTVCHEHLEYYNLKQLKFICDKVNLKIIDIEFNNINGGSISITASKRSSFFSEAHNLHQLLDIEEQEGFNSTEIYNQFRENITIQKQKLIDFLNEARRANNSVYALGASTKGNTLLQYWDINTSLISAIGEVNGDKFGCYTPGSNIPIISEDEVLAVEPDFIIILPWHFADFFKNNPKFYNTALVFPLPTFRLQLRSSHE